MLFIFSITSSNGCGRYYGRQKRIIWFASFDKGVYSYDGRSIVNFNQKEGLGENYAGGIAQDKAGNTWFATKNGICKYDGKSFTEYTSKDGLGGTE
ncbi:MAG TPA: histidine kinase, partial [Cytophagaceae bacterium]